YERFRARRQRAGVAQRASSGRRQAADASALDELLELRDVDAVELHLVDRVLQMLGLRVVMPAVAVDADDLGVHHQDLARGRDRAAREDARMPELAMALLVEEVE